MRKAEKIELTEEYKQLVDSAAALILFDYRGTSVEEFTQLRRDMRAQGGSIRVIRNRMLKWAVEDLPFAEISEHLVGPTALAMATEDPAATAKVLVDFARSHEPVQVKCGVIDGRAISAKQVTDLARLPSREVLMAQVLSGMIAPMTILAVCLQAPHQQLLGLIEAYRGKLEEAA